jgi:chromosome partitioning protein
LINQVKARTAYHRQLIAQLRQELGVRYRVYEATIPDSVRVQEAAQARLPVGRYDPGGPAAAAYRQLAREVLAHAA